MILSFHPCFVADHQIIMGDRRLNSDNLASINEAGAIILPQSCSSELFRACKNSAAYLFPSYETRFEYPGKTGQSLLFKKAGLPQPETARWHSVEEFAEACRKSFPHGMPFLLKEDKSHEAHGVHVIEDNRAYEMVLERLRRIERSGAGAFISQEMIPAEGNVLRVVIIGRKTFSYWKRPESNRQVITTLSRGARIDNTWRTDLQEKGREEAGKLSALTGLNLAAVDFIFPLAQANPQPLFLEINYYFGRRGLGGSLNYYRLLFEAIKEWLREKRFDPGSVRLV